MYMFPNYLKKNHFHVSVFDYMQHMKKFRKDFIFYIRKFKRYECNFI